MHYVSNLKRSVATLASAAGLLAAAAGPASAQVMPGTIGVTTPRAGHGHQIASDTRCTVTCLDQDLTTLKPPAQSSSPHAGTNDDAQDPRSVAELHAAQRNSLGRENSIEI